VTVTVVWAIAARLPINIAKRNLMLTSLLIGGRRILNIFLVPAEE
jgi:hypothetical protein